MRWLRWPALVWLLAGALDLDHGRLGSAETPDPSVRDVRLRAVQSALPPRRRGWLCLAAWRDWPGRYCVRGRPTLWRAPQRARDPSRFAGASAGRLRAKRDQSDPALR